MKFTLFLLTLLCSLPYSITAHADCTNQSFNLTITKPDGIYTNNGDGTVSDTNTGLMWQICPLGLSGTGCATGTLQTQTWQAALASAVADTGSGYTDWRLPNKNELISLVDYACLTPAINDSIFPATLLPQLPLREFYWSSTPIRFETRVWAVDFIDGATVPANKTNANSGHVRLVRGFELLDSTVPAPTAPIAP